MFQQASLEAELQMYVLKKDADEKLKDKVSYDTTCSKDIFICVLTNLLHPFLAHTFEVQLLNLLFVRFYF